MKAVVDTNVVAYYLLGTEPFVEEARQFWRTVEEPCAPSHWEAELANAVWMAVRSRHCSGFRPRSAPGTMPKTICIRSISVRVFDSSSLVFDGLAGPR